MPTAMLIYGQRGAAVTLAELQQILAESGVTLQDGWFGPNEVPGRGAGPVLTDPALIVLGQRAADLGWHVAQGAAIAGRSHERGVDSRRGEEDSRASRP